VTTPTAPPEPAAPTRPPARLVDVHWCAARAGCSWRHFLRLADRGAAPPGIKLGALRRWDAEEIERWIAAGCKPVQQAGRA
jgi:predicted DNA-binding transcriptional regulator AlpA